MLTYLLTLPGKLYVHANFESQLRQHPSADCTCFSKPLQELMVTAVRAVTGDASFHLLYGSDTQSDSSGAAPATDSAVADSPSMPKTSATATMAAPRRSGRQHKPAAEYWKVPPAAPGGLNKPAPTPPLQLLSLNVNELRERQKWAAFFAVLQAGPWHVIALQETHHATQAEAAQ